MRERQIGKQEILFAVAFAVFLATVVLDMSLFDADGRLVQLFRYCGYALAVFKLFCGEHDRDHLTLYVAGIAVLIAGFAINRNRIMVLYALIIIAALSVDHTLVLKIHLIVQSIMLAMIVVFSQCGWLEDFVATSGSRFRHFLGFTYTTYPVFIFFFIMLDYICLRSGILRLWEYLAGMAVSVWFYAKTDTNFTFWLSVLMLTFFFVFGRALNRGYITCTFRKLFILAPWLIALITIAAQYFYNDQNEVMYKINDFIHGRLHLGHSGIEVYGLRPFGSVIEWIGNSYKDMNPAGYNMVDSSYLQIALQQGILLFVIILALFSYIIHRSIKCNRYYIAWSILFALMLSATESTLVNPVYSPFIMLAFCKMEKDGEVSDS